MRVVLACSLLVLALGPIVQGKVRVGIVGAGVGGSSTAYQLRQLLGEDVEIVVFEKGKVGGRVTTIDVDGQSFEAGGTIIHPRNQYMENFTALLGTFGERCHLQVGVIATVQR